MENPTGCLSIHLSQAALHTSYINGVVSFVVDLFPASRASVSILKGIAEALATKDVATFCRNNETSVLYNLENIKKKKKTAFVCALVPEQQQSPENPTSAELRGGRARQVRRTEYTHLLCGVRQA